MSSPFYFNPRQSKLSLSLLILVFISLSNVLSKTITAYTGEDRCVSCLAQLSQDNVTVCEGSTEKFICNNNVSECIAFK